MKIILSHPTGNANVRATAKAFAEAQMLDSFYTTVAAFPGSPLDRFGAINALSEIRRRRFDPSLRSVTKMYPWYEIGRMASAKLGLKHLIRHQSGLFSVDAVYRSLDKFVSGKLPKKAISGGMGIYAYEDGAELCFREAKKAGLKCFYDLPTGYWRAAQRLLRVEHERWPAWMPTMIGFQDSNIKLQSKDIELSLADMLIVASRFTLSTLADYPGTLPSIKVIPYGFPPASENAVEKTATHGKLKLLFVGKLSQQKGIADLFAAVEGLKEFVSLTLVGQKIGGDCPALDAALTQHRWIPSLPHREILNIMREHDVLAFPTLFDGFGLVITEAMSQGTPVIASERSAGPDLITHGENGWLFNAGSIESLTAVIEDILQKRGSLSTVAKAALQSARCRPWEKFREETRNAILNS